MLLENGLDLALDRRLGRPGAVENGALSSSIVLTRSAQSTSFRFTADFGYIRWQLAPPDQWPICRISFEQP
jgi:hypothetical protein